MTIAKTQANDKIRADRQALRVEADAYRVRRMEVKRGTARALRRAAGNFKPVNEAASLAQAPDGKFAKSYAKKKSMNATGTTAADFVAAALV